MASKRAIYEHYVKNNIYRLSDETLLKIIALMEDEVDASIDKETAEADNLVDEIIEELEDRMKE